jgi:hypothetical protein
MNKAKPLEQQLRELEARAEQLRAGEPLLQLSKFPRLLFWLALARLLFGAS